MIIFETTYERQPTNRMKFLKYILFLLLIAIIGLSIYIAVQPNSFEVVENRSIKAPASVIFETIRDTSSTDRSSFWKKNELLQASSYVEPVSIQQSYTSNDIPNSELGWQLKANGNGTTQVTRTLAAKNLSFLYKAKTVFSGGTESDIKEKFEGELKQLEDDVLKSMSVYSIKVDGITEYGGGFYMYKTTSSTASNISNMTAKQNAELLNFMQANSIETTGDPFTIYNTMNDDGSVIMSNALPVQNKIIVADDSNILCGYMDRTRVLKTTLKGDYTNLKEAWTTAKQYAKDTDLEASEMPVFEIFTKDSSTSENPANWVTELYIPLKPEPVQTEQM